MLGSGKKLVIVSNRLPVVIERGEEGTRVVAGSGGLVTAMAPVMERAGGCWIGWPGPEGQPGDVAGLVAEFASHHAFDLNPVSLTAEEIHKYYTGFSNQTLWPLFHMHLGHCRFEREDWLAYQDANQRFAEAAAERAAEDSVIWVHDYHLLLVGERLRRLGVKRPLAFFLHIPFPSADLFRRLPWKHSIIRAMMEYDLIGFQTLRDRRNFVDCVREYAGDVKVETGRRQSLIAHGGRVVRAGHFPISIDFDDFDRAARSPEVRAEAERFRAEFPCQCVMMGLDRLDYTKGITERLLAFERALLKYPELQGNICLIQFLIPSRVEVPDYAAQKRQLDELVGRINGNFSRIGWTPLHYRFRSLSRTELVARYLASEIALVTPLGDGMNLVCKEYCASQTGLRGALILSEFAGAADRLERGALMVNPYDCEGVADAIHRAFRMGPEERERRMTHLRSEVKRNDVHGWARWFLESFDEGAAGAARREGALAGS